MDKKSTTAPRSQTTTELDKFQLYFELVPLEKSENRSKRS